MVEKVILSWSGGKDSTLALYEIQRMNNYKIVALLTTITRDYDRSSLHGIRRILLERQAESLGYNLKEVFVSKDDTDEQYEQKMREILSKYQDIGVCSVVFGDIFLEDVRNYRNSNLAKIRMEGIFPLWKSNTYELACEFIDLGFKAVITCVDSKVLDGRYVGRIFDGQFLSELPPAVDPCGENGEFHSFVYDGPTFRWKIPFKIGETVLRENRYYYCDLVPV